MNGEKFDQLHTETTTAVATSKYSGKSDPHREQNRKPTTPENSRVSFMESVQEN